MERTLNAIKIFERKFQFNENSEKRKVKSYALLPLLPPARRVVSCGIGVTSSILPTLKPLRAIALIAACAPGPGVLGPVPPTALTLICTAVMPFDFATSAAAEALFMAA
jgi:hypothetical protein